MQFANILKRRSHQEIFLSHLAVGLGESVPGLGLLHVLGAGLDGHQPAELPAIEAVVQPAKLLLPPLGEKKPAVTTSGGGGASAGHTGTRY